MNALNTVFFDEFKSLDQLCRDIYGDDATPKLGVTLYLEHMEADMKSQALYTHNFRIDGERYEKRQNKKYNKMYPVFHHFLCTDGSSVGCILSEDQ